MTIFFIDHEVQVFYLIHLHMVCVCASTYAERTKTAWSIPNQSWIFLNCTHGVRRICGNKFKINDSNPTIDFKKIKWKQKRKPPKILEYCIPLDWPINKRYHSVSWNVNLKHDFDGRTSIDKKEEEKINRHEVLSCECASCIHEIIKKIITTKNRSIYIIYQSNFGSFVPVLIIQ